jgi:hypothetical protein
MKFVASFLSSMVSKNKIGRFSSCLVFRGVIPLFGKEGQGEIFRTAAAALLIKSLSVPLFKRGKQTCNPIDACFGQE